MSPPAPTASTAPASPPALLDRRALNLPNLITLIRLLLALALFVVIELGDLWVTATVLFVVAVSTDVLDGYLARKYGLVTVLGRILDPFVDKLVIGGSFIFLQGRTVDGLSSGIAAWMTFVIIARELFITSLRAVLESAGRDFSAQWTGKLKMFLQSVTVPVCLLSLSRPCVEALAPYLSLAQFQGLRDVMLWGTVGVTLYSGIEYLLRAAALSFRGAQSGS